MSVLSIRCHPKYKLRRPYITVKGRGQKSSVWLHKAGEDLEINLNVRMGLRFKNKDDARQWAVQYAQEFDLLYVEDKRKNQKKF